MHSATLYSNSKTSDRTPFIRDYGVILQTSLKWHGPNETKSRLLLPKLHSEQIETDRQINKITEIRLRLFGLSCET